MNDVWIVYLIFMYLFTAGMVGAGIRYCNPMQMVGMFINLILAPVITPVLLGIAFFESN